MIKRPSEAEIAQADIMDAMLSRARILGRTRMFPDDKDVATITEQERQSVASQINIFCKNRGISRQEVGRDLGVSPGVISEVLNGKYKGNWRGLIHQLDKWLELREENLKLGEDQLPFCWTNVAEEIRGVYRYVQSEKTIGLIYGPDAAGFGKTMTLQALKRLNPGCMLVTCTVADANPTGILRAIAREMGIDDWRSTRLLYGHIKDKLIGTNRVLIVDQIHNLRNRKDDKPLYILSDLWDETGAPQLWCGTADMAAYFTKGRSRGDESLTQIRSRIGYFHDLMQRAAPVEDGGRGEPLFTLEDIQKVFAASAMRIAPESLQMLYELANIPDSGALRTCVRVWRLALAKARESGAQNINAQTLRAGINLLVYPQAVRLFNARMQSVMPARRRMA